MSKYSKQKCNSAGFTLVEMLVSLSLFTVVLTMSVGTLLVLIDANGRAQSMQLIMSNLTFALDSMTREIRTSTDWYCRSGGLNATIPRAQNLSHVNATRDCDRISASSDKYISVIETGGSLTGNLAPPGRITYYFDNDYHANGNGALLRSLGGSDSAPQIPPIPLTGEEIDIDEFRVTVSGTTRYNDNVSSEDTEQPTMTLYIKGTAGVDVQAKEFSLQTSVTQRSLDL